MNSASHSSVPPAPGSPLPNAARWPLGILAGFLASVPLAGLLSFAALLPFYLGPFFFLLFGLVLGACVFRAARTARPIRAAPLLAGTAAVVLFVFVLAIQLEYMQLGGHCGNSTLKTIQQLPPDTSAEQFRRYASGAIRAHLRSAYPPGGVLGYVRWAATDGRFSAPAPEGTHPATMRYRLSQSNLGWTLRVIISLLLLTGGVYSQTWPLRRPVGPEPSPGAASEPSRRVEQNPHSD